MEKKIAAFFDIDGTIYRDALVTEVFKKLVTYEVIDQHRWIDEVRPAFMAWDRRQGDYDTYLAKVAGIFQEITVGASAAQMAYVANKVVEQKGERVYAFSRSEIERHRKEGHLLIAISGSPDVLVKAMAEKYEFDDWRGSVYHIDENGNYNGKIEPMWDHESKEKALLELAGIHHLDLDACYSYGDTNGDITMFQYTGHPTAINPTRELLTNIAKDPALRAKTRVVVERKDMIYHLTPDVIPL